MSAINILLKRLTRQNNWEREIYGVHWNKGSSPVLTRTHDAVGMTAAVGVDGQFVQNDFDTAAIFREMGPVTDELGNVFTRIPKHYVRKTDFVVNRQHVCLIADNLINLQCCYFVRECGNLQCVD